jgi:large subunit ribosomal protein L18e
MKETKSTNTELIALIRLLKKKSREKQAAIWHDIAEDLSKSRSGRAAVNLSQINRHTKRSDLVVIPGKILATGNLNHALTIAAFGISGKAEEKLKAVKAKYLSIPELIENYPTGANVKIIR